MGYQEAISAAIGAHGLWKGRLRTAIDLRKSDFDPAVVAQKDQCAFGKWFYALPPAVRLEPLPTEVESLHASFHVEAAVVIQAALAGDKAAAERGLGEGSAYLDLSMKLVGTLMAWMKIVDQRSA